MLLENIHIKIGTKSNYSQGANGGKTGPVGPGWPEGVMCGQDPVICGSDNKTCADQGEGGGESGAQLPCFGTHDYRPHDTGAECSYYCRTPAKAHGLYAENVHGLTLKNVTFEFEQPRKSWFGECLKVDNRSTGVVGAEDVHCIGGPAPMN